MRSIRPSLRRSARRRPALLAAGLVAALAMTATACNGDDDSGSSDASGSSASQGSGKGSGSDASDLAGDLANRLKQHGIDVDDWKKGGWKNWDKDKWLHDAKDFVNPVIDGLWKPDRMKSAKDPAKTVKTQDASDDQGVSDPEPQPVQAQEEKLPYHENAAPVGKVFFDSPEGSMVCSGTIVKDPMHPGKSNMVWTAGHCVHAGAGGGWYRNIAFVPSYNDNGKSADQISAASPQEVAPYGQFWADWVSTSNEWISGGSESGGEGAPYDYAILHVKPEHGTKSLEETVGAGLDVDFSAPSAQEAGTTGAWGYPAAPPYDGQKMFKCLDQPGRLSIAPSKPTMYRIGCTMTGGSSGGGWFHVVDGKTKLVSNTSIGPVTNGWLAGPQLGDGAKQLFDMMAEKYDGS
ncbi:trypsin-like serine peptidase [Streptomyces sp. NPDC050560]|uniref:trypsin-like serine peptidase n=1 Tax=Streptomyces sp. NPDC050560 TaxID=3365630 RepID=UPI0037A6BC35